MKTPTIQPETLNFTQRLARADSEIARLVAQEKQVVLNLQTDQAELTALNAQAETHDLSKRTIQDTINARRSVLKEAEAQATISEGTLSEKPDLKKLEKLLKQAQAEQLVILDRIGKEEQAEERRHFALTEAINRHHQTLAHLSENRKAMEAAKARVWAEYGQAEYEACLQELNALQADLEARKQASLRSREAIDDLTRKAQERLQKWPDLAAQYLTRAPFHNTTTEVLEAALSLIDLLLERGREVEALDTSLLREAGIPYGTVDNLLSWDTSACYPVLHHTGQPPVVLHQRQKDLSQLLSVYIAAKQGRR